MERKPKTICFVTTGDITTIATAKRALGLANPLSDSGWIVHIIMEDTAENRHRAALECDERVRLHFFHSASALNERKIKSLLLKKIKPDYVYLCAFVFRNIVSVNSQCKKLVEHCELRSAIKDVKWWRRGFELLNEYFSLIYANGILNASIYLQRLYEKRAGIVLKSRLPMLYFPYAYNKNVCKRSDCQREFPIRKSESDIFITYLGSLSKAYHTLDIVKAMQLIGQTNIKLLLLGGGDDSQRIKTYIKENNLDGYVFMPGYIKEEDIQIYFSLTSVFVLPMNNTIQDKARCPSKLYMYLPYNKPIVTAKIGEPYEVLKDKGVYYDTGSVKSLSLAIQEAIGMKVLDIPSKPHEWGERARFFDKWINDIFEC